MTRRFVVFGLLFTLALAGCARSAVPSLNGPPSPIGTPAPSPLSSPQIASAFSLIFQRSGGFVGADDTWTIDPQGKVTRQGSSTSTQLTTAQLAELDAAIRAANFMNLEKSYLLQDTCCDRYEYTIVVTTNGQSKTVRTIDASPAAPPALTALVNALNRLVATPAPDAP